MSNSLVWGPKYWRHSASEILSEQASEETGFVFWFRNIDWSASASEILNEEASDESGQSNDSVLWPPFIWAAGASEILNEQVSEETGQSTDDF